MAANGDEGDPPSRVGWPVVDTYTGTLAALAVLAALLQKERFQEGQYIDVGMLDASLVMLTSLATPYLVTGQMLPRTGNIGYSGSPTSAVFPTRDGDAISLGVVQDNQFEVLCRAIGKPELVADPRFATLIERAKPPHARVLREQLNAVFMTRTGLEWEQRLNAAGAPCGLIRDIANACDAARHTERHLIEAAGVKLPTGETRTAEYLNAGFVFAKDGPGGPKDVPELGRDTREVLRSLAYQDADIDALIAQRVVRTAL
jgi:crotonobetainyl-CoA:carnitine CoA-transferase CaiB-like acyl-CoA transferase